MQIQGKEGIITIIPILIKQMKDTLCLPQISKYLSNLPKEVK